MADKKWHIMIGNEKKGPFTDDEVKELLHDGRIHGNTEIKLDGMDFWSWVYEFDIFGVEKQVDIKVEKRNEIRNDNYYKVRPLKYKHGFSITPTAVLILIGLAGVSWLLQLNGYKGQSNGCSVCGFPEFFLILFILSMSFPILWDIKKSNQSVHESKNADDNNEIEADYSKIKPASITLNNMFNIFKKLFVLCVGFAICVFIYILSFFVSPTCFLMMPPAFYITLWFVI